jgi:putative copper export protein
VYLLASVSAHYAPRIQRSHGTTHVPTEPLITWSEPVLQFISFLGLFFSTGAVGFRYSALRGRLTAVPLPATTPPAGAALDQPIYALAAKRAAAIGLFGMLIRVVLLVVDLPGMAARKHLAVGAFVASDFMTWTQIVLLVLALSGFLLAWRGAHVGWLLAAIGVVGVPLRGALIGQWSRLVNPLHVLFAGLWIGTLFVLFVAGLLFILRHEAARERRGRLAADLVNGFSPLALVSSGFVALFGVITAWTHLNPLSSLWTTPYGYALITKLLVVAVVVTLGAFNWRRQRPTLGTHDAAVSIARSSRMELTAAFVVLVITAVLVSLPSPRRPPAPGAGPGPGSASPMQGPPPT